MSSRTTKRRRLNGKQAAKATAQESLNAELDDPSFSFAGNVGKVWDKEQDYETRPRTHERQEKAARLPIRTDSGWVAQQKEEPASEAESLDLPDADEGGLSGEEAEEEEKPKIPQKELILQAKEELAKIAGQIHEDPDENIGALKQLTTLAETDNVHVKRLALLTQLSIYKDLIPGYRIRPLTEAEQREKVTRDIKKLRAYEQKLVTGYKSYIDDLTRLAKPKAQADTPGALLASAAFHCATILLVSAPHFNFRTELINILTRKVATFQQDTDWFKCSDAFEQLFREDEDGHQSFEAVQILSRMIKAKHYAVQEEVLNMFLHLRLLSEFSSKASNSTVDKDGPTNGKKKKEKKVFLTKKERKALREKKALETEMREADAAVSHEDRDRMQGETLKIVLGVYFRILKTRESRMMGAVLEGLARYAHLINQDFFGDILEVLREMIAEREALKEAVAEDEEEETSLSFVKTRNITRETLLCAITAFALLEGQDASASASSLGLDLSYFVDQLYRSLYPVSLDAEIEFSSKSLRLDDPGFEPSASRRRRDKINVQTTIVLLIRCLSSTLLPEKALRSVPPVRLAAFTKQMLTVSMQLPEKSAIAMLGLCTQVLKAHGRKVAPLWHTEERKGDGVFDPLKAELEASNPFASTIYEGEILRLHYCPTVREAVVGIEREVVASK